MTRLNTMRARPGGARARSAAGLGRGFTLLEVMIALAVLAIAMLALLALDHQDLQSVIRGQDLSRAAMLAQGLMTQVETQVEAGGYPDLGTSSGDFQQLYPRQYPNFKWLRVVAASGDFPDIRKVAITVFYGPRFGRRFDLIEFLHNPVPPQAEGQG